MRKPDQGAERERGARTKAGTVTVTEAKALPELSAEAGAPRTHGKYGGGACGSARGLLATSPYGGAQGQR